MKDLHVDSVIKSFDSKQVLTDIFISCTSGKIIGLLGKNGSGKSTLLKIIFGSLSADRKFIKIGDKIINGLYDNRSLINYLPQDSFLPNHIRIKNIVSLFCDNKNALIIKDNVLIKPMLDKRAKQLSGGEKRLLEIFMIVYSRAKYVLIDEPFNGIAPIYKDDIKQIIKEQSKFKGFIITDHDYRNILDISTHKILLHDGGTRVFNNNDDLKHFGYVPNNR